MPSGLATRPDWLSWRAHAGGDLMSEVTERKAALVTGGAVRLGRAIAISLAAAGFDIALHYNTSEAEYKRPRRISGLTALAVSCSSKTFAEPTT